MDKAIHLDNVRRPAAHREPRLEFETLFAESMKPPRERHMWISRMICRQAGGGLGTLSPPFGDPS